MPLPTSKPPTSLPPQARLQPPGALRSSPPPVPSIAPSIPRGQAVTQAIKDQICEMALGILEEQVQARIVHYRADLETNPELDAITAQVVASLKELQASSAQGAQANREAMRDSQIKLLTGLLQRVFRPSGPSLLVEKRLKEVHRKLARLFFQSELHEKTSGKDPHAKVIQHGEQAVFYLLTRYKNRLEADLAAFDYTSEETKEHAFEVLARFGKEMQDAFLARRSSELKRIVKVFQGVLADFFEKHLAPANAALAAEVVTQSASFEGRAYGYKVTAEAFPRFRAAFERRLMVRLVGFAEDELVAHLADTAGADRDETIQFVTDPRVFSMIVGELSEGVYEFLCNEGFLDLPSDWRQVATA